MKSKKQKTYCQWILAEIDGLRSMEAILTAPRFALEWK